MDEQSTPNFAASPRAGDAVSVGDDDDIHVLIARAQAGDMDARARVQDMIGTVATDKAIAAGAQNKFAISVIMNGKRVYAPSIRQFMLQNKGKKMKLPANYDATTVKPRVKELTVRYQKDNNGNPIKSWGERDDFKRLVERGYLQDPRDVNGLPLDLTGSKAYNH